MKKPLTRVMWWVFFALASFELSLCLQTFKTFTLTPDWPNGLKFLGAVLLLAVTSTVLVYDSYVQERLQGKVQHPIRLFEWAYKRQQSSARCSAAPVESVTAHNK